MAASILRNIGQIVIFVAVVAALFMLQAGVWVTIIAVTPAVVGGALLIGFAEIITLLQRIEENTRLSPESVSARQFSSDSPVDRFIRGGSNGSRDGGT